MDDDTKNKLKDVLSTIDPVEFQYNTSAEVDIGFTAQTIDDGIYISNSVDTITLNDINGSMTMPSITSIDMSTIGNITLGAVGNSSNWANGASFTIGSGLSSDSTEYGKNEIRLGNGKSIDLDDLHATIETVKKRLLIIAPNFEMHEKYPMLKELYDEYKAMEKLLSGPDRELDE